MYSRKAVYSVRLIFLLVCGSLGGLIAAGLNLSIGFGVVTGTFFASVFIAIDILARSWSFHNFSAGTFGLMVGLFCAWLITRINLSQIPLLSEEITFGYEIRSLVELALYLALGFMGSTLALRSNREEFSFIIPYVRFRREAIEEQPTLLDSNILIDGRILKLVKTGFLRGPFVVPRFVVEEMTALSESPLPLKRERGRRGLSNVQELRRRMNVEVNIHDDYEDNKNLPVDTRLVQLTRRLGARLLTNDASLGQVARLQSVFTLNLNDLAEAMKPEVLVGEVLNLELVKRGKDPHQAVGFLPDGTMIVVNHAANFIGSTHEVTVSSSIQTASGRLIFAELTGDKQA